MGERLSTRHYRYMAGMGRYRNPTAQCISTWTGWRSSATGGHRPGNCATAQVHCMRWTGLRTWCIHSSPGIESVDGLAGRIQADLSVCDTWFVCSRTHIQWYCCNVSWSDGGNMPDQWVVCQSCPSLYTSVALSDSFDRHTSSDKTDCCKRGTHFTYRSQAGLPLCQPLPVCLWSLQTTPRVEGVLSRPFCGMLQDSWTAGNLIQ